MKTISNYYTISAYIFSFVEYFEILKSKKTEKMLHLKKYFLLINFIFFIFTYISFYSENSNINQRISVRKMRKLS